MSYCPECARLRAENADLRVRLAEAERRLKSWSDGETTWEVPTAWAWAQSCKTVNGRQLTAEKRAAEAERRAEEAEKSLYWARVRMFKIIRSKTPDHTTACTIWGDDGQGGTKEGFKQPLPCNCGALENFHKGRAEELAAALDKINLALEMAYQLINDGSMRSEEWEAFKLICSAISHRNQTGYAAILSRVRAKAAADALEKRESCRKCGGRGKILVQMWRTYETDSKAEVADAHRKASCPECGTENYRREAGE